MKLLAALLTPDSFWLHTDIKTSCSLRRARRVGGWDQLKVKSSSVNLTFKATITWMFHSSAARGDAIDLTKCNRSNPSPNTFCCRHHRCLVGNAVQSDDIGCLRWRDKCSGVVEGWSLCRGSVKGCEVAAVSVKLSVQTKTKLHKTTTAHFIDSSQSRNTKLIKY